MRYKVFTVALISTIIISCDSLGISSKLDFGDDTKPAIIGTASRKNFKIENSKSGGDFDNIGVVCTSGGCNVSTSTESTDTIQADIVVHVKTSVDVNKTKTAKPVEDVPDVPVVVGTFDPNHPVGAQGRTFNQRPSVITDYNLSPKFVPSYRYYGYGAPRIESDSVYVQKSGEPRVDINIKTLPPVTFTMMDDGRTVKGIRYTTNGLEGRYPYFDPSLQNHYFGETPPQLYWYPRSSAPKSTWKPSLWGSQTPHKHASGTTCKCNEHQTPAGLQWQSRRVGTDPGAHIDDKLAPLN